MLHGALSSPFEGIRRSTLCGCAAVNPQNLATRLQTLVHTSAGHQIIFKIAQHIPVSEAILHRRLTLRK
jgi:hypothetical protein